MAQELQQSGQQKAGQQTMPAEGAERTRTRRVFTPRTDIYETKDAIVLLAEMPGVASDAVDITLEKRTLTIHGHAGEREHRGYRQVYAEYAEGDYERSFTLSEDIDRDRIEATQSNGILRLVLPKAEPAKAKKIQVKSA
jgi:HSP20 family molecular chaperone IbpA